MRKKILLHIGRNKTGSTALQNFLFLNRTKLFTEHGLFYPNCGIRVNAHHDVAELFARKNIRSVKDLKLALVDSTASHLLEELRQTTFERAVISSEAFQNADPADIALLFSEFDVTVVVYLREQSSYLASAFAQRVHATVYTDTPTEFVRTNLEGVDYVHFLQDWNRAFNNKVSVAIYSLPNLKCQDIRADFIIRHLGLSLDKELRSFDLSKRENVSLSNTVLRFKWQINHVMEAKDERNNRLYRVLESFSRQPQYLGPYRINKELHDLIRLRFQSANSLLSKRLTSEVVIPDFDLEEDKLPGLSEKQFWDLSKLLLKNGIEFTQAEFEAASRQAARFDL